MSNELLFAAAGNVETGDPTDANFENTVLLLNADGASDGGQNNTFRDVSGNGHSITRNGNVTQGSFSPFSVDDGKWGNYFEQDDYLTAATNASFDVSGAYTAECWLYVDTFPSGALGATGQGFVMCRWTASGNQRSWGIFLGNNGALALYHSATGTSSYTTAVASAGTITGSTWHHVAATWDGTTMRLFVDGIVVASTADASGPYSTPNAGVTLNALNVSLTGTGIKQYISNARYLPNEALYTANFTPSTTPLTAVTNTELLVAQSNRFVDNSSNAHSITVNGDPEVVPFSPFPQTTAYTQSVVNQGSVKFDGNDYLQSSGTVNFSTYTNVTLETWVYPTSLNGSGSSVETLMGTASGASGYTMFYLYGDGKIGIGITGVNEFVSATGTITNNQWHHVAAVKEGSTTTIYVNGTSVASSSTGVWSNNTDNVNIARGGTSEYFTGYLSNVRIVLGTAVYTADFTVPTAPLEAITNTSLLTCQANGFVDNSSNAHTITVNGNPERTTNVPFGERSVEFDGSGDWLTVPTTTDFAMGTGDFTVECWFNATSSSARGLFHITTGHLNSQATGIGLGVSTNAGNPWRVYHGTTATDTSSNLVTGSWQHIAIVRNGTAINVYLNGTSIYSATDSSDLSSYTYLTVGAWYSSTYPWIGNISNLRVVKGTAVYTADFTPPTEPLTAITNTSLLTCQNAVFQDNSGNAHAITVNGNAQASTNLPFGERSVYFDGSGDYLTTSADTSLSVGTSDFTLESWVFWSNVGSNNRIFIDTRSGSTADGFNIGLSSTNYYLKMFYNSSDVIIDDVIFPENEWVHVALSRSGSSTKLFKNGVQVGSTYSDSNNYSNNDIIIGNNSSLNRDWGGYLSNTRLVKGTALYTADFTVPTEPLTAVSGTSLLTCQDAVFQDNSGNAHAITVNGDAEASTNIPFAPVTTYGVQQYLDDAFTVSPQGGSAYFDGSGDYLTTANNTNFEFGSGDFTIDFWFYSPDVTSITTVYAYISNGLTGFVIRLQSNYIGLVNYSSGIYNILLNTPANLKNNSWHHFALTRNGNTFTAYLDGESVATTSSALTLTTGQTPTIGKWTNYTTRDFNGYISDFRIIKGTAIAPSGIPTSPISPITNTKLLLNFTNASILDATGKNVIETVGNAQVDTTTVKYGTGAMEFDGTGDYLTVPTTHLFDDISNGEFTIEAWINIADNNNRGFFHLAGQYFDNYFDGYVVGQNGTDQLFVSHSGTFTQQASIGYSLNTWFHIALVRNSSGTLKLFVDGIEKISVTDTTSTATTHLLIGGYYTTSNLMKGFIDDFRITKGIARYTANFTPPTKALPVIGE